MPLAEIDVKTFSPNSKPQADFLSSSADIVIAGGSAYGGKTFGIFLEAARHIENSRARTTIFRRTTPEITKQGGLWDIGSRLYSRYRPIPRESPEHRLKFPSGYEIVFAHLEYDKTVKSFQGAQIPVMIFDQLEQFSGKQFFYMMSRNRDGSEEGCGFKPYIRATANPVPSDDPVGGWLNELISWWIDNDEFNLDGSPNDHYGYAIDERSGIIRYFTRVNDKTEWVDESWRDENGVGPTSITFIRMKYTDNKTGIERDPGYISYLNGMERIDRLRMKDGNWHVTEKGGMFQKGWFEIVDRAPRMKRLIRYWDRAHTKKRDPKLDAGKREPDWTAGVLAGIDEYGVMWILDVQHEQLNPLGTEKLALQIAKIDGVEVEVYIEEEGPAGIDVVDYYQRTILPGYTVYGHRPKGDKIIRAKPWCAMAERGNVKLVRGAWNIPFLSEAANYPMGKKDQIDATSGAHYFLNNKPPFVPQSLSIPWL